MMLIAGFVPYRKMWWLRLATFAVRETDAGAVGVTTRGGRDRRRRDHYG